jgi:hypothetical protein
VLGKGTKETFLAPQARAQHSGAPGLVDEVERWLIVLLSCQKNVPPNLIPDFCLPEPVIVFSLRQIGPIAAGTALHIRPSHGRFHPLQLFRLPATWAQQRQAGARSLQSALAEAIQHPETG